MCYLLIYTKQSSNLMSGLLTLEKKQEHKFLPNLYDYIRSCFIIIRYFEWLATILRHSSFQNELNIHDDTGFHNKSAQVNKRKNLIVIGFSCS